MTLSKFPFFKQLDRTDCGPTCLKMIAKHHGRDYPLPYLRDLCFLTADGVSLLGISDAAEAIGMRSFAATISYESLRDEIPLPCIAHWRQRHYVVVYKVKKNKVYVADPQFGHMTYTRKEFEKGWLNSVVNEDNDEGLVMALDPSPEFYNDKVIETKETKGLGILLPYLRPYNGYLFQLVLGLISVIGLQLIFPFLTQSIVDYGIKNQNIGFIYIIMIAHIMLFFSQSAIEVIRGWLLLHMGSRINISIISDYLIKLTKLPLSFFSVRHVGDVLERIADNRRIEQFLSAESLNMLFSIFSLLVFGAVLLFYNLKIFLLFLFGSSFYVLWVLLFMKRRASLEYKRFDEAADNTNSLHQMIMGMQEIKLNNSQRRRRWKWEAVQIRLFKLSLKGLVLEQYQGAGGNFINEFKNILITFVAAKAVIDGQMTLGMMLAVQYIIGQLNVPINNFVRFIQSAQDARISLERLNEVQNMEDEVSSNEENILSLPPQKDITLKNIHFQYGGPRTPMVLNDISVTIPEGKVTAIVGASGSGKTTLLKVLLKFYKPIEGKIQIGHFGLNNYHADFWRQNCGVVMQEGFIFGDTLANNITESEGSGQIDKKRLLYAAKVANIEEFIDSLPNGYLTKIGVSGLQLSGGQKQRVLIARAVYKNPPYLFFDEATSALDANNEKIIMENLESFYEGKTVVVIAHRLSTVKNADQILVLDQGKIIEVGNHEELVKLQGAYFNLVKNQLELGN